MYESRKIGGTLVPTSTAIGLLACLLCLPAFAGFPSLNVEHQIDDIVVDLDGVPAQFVVIQDTSSPSQWYYVPDSPRVAVRQLGGNEVPEFALVKYQTDDPDVEAGLLQISFSLRIPDAAIQQLRQEIMQRKGLSDVNIAPLPMKSAEVFLFTPSGDQLVSNAQTNEDGLAPTFATQKIAVQMELSRLGSEVFEALTAESAGGVGVAVAFTYSGLTPELMCEASVNWEEAHKYFDQNKEFAAKVGAFGGLVKGEMTKTRREIREELEQKGLVSMRSITGGNLSNEDCQRLAFDPLMARMQKALFSTTSLDPAAIAKAAHDDSAGGEEGKKLPKAGWFGSASYRVSVVDIERARSYSETVSFRTREVVEQKTVVSGFVGIGDYPEEVRKNAVLQVSDRPWNRVLVMLPSIPLEYDINNADLTIRPSIDAAIPEQDFRWTPASGWVNYRGTPASYAYFPLADLGDSVELHGGVPVEVSWTLVHKGQAFNVSNTLEADQDNNIAQDVYGIEAVRLIDDGLTWARLNNGDGVVRVTAKLQSGGNQKQLEMRPKNVDGVWQPPDVQFWLIDGGQPVSAEVNLRMSSGETVQWEHSGGNLRDAPDGLTIALDDSIWRQQ